MPSSLKVVWVDWLCSNAFKHNSLRYLVNLPTEGRSGRKTVRFLTRELVHSWGGLGMIEKQTTAIPKITNRFGSAPPVIII